MSATHVMPAWRRWSVMQGSVHRND